MGLSDQPGFGRYHEALNRARWDARDVARRLLRHLLAVLSPSGEVVIAIDDTIERRWGAKIKARGIHRDPVRSSHGQFVKPAVCAGCLWRWCCRCRSQTGDGRRPSRSNGARHRLRNSIVPRGGRGIKDASAIL